MRLATLIARNRDDHYRWPALFAPSVVMAEHQTAARRLARTDRVAAVAQFMEETGLSVESARDIVLPGNRNREEP